MNGARGPLLTNTTRFECVYGDSKSNPPFAQSEALRLINQDQVQAIVADSSGVAVAINRLNYDANASQAKVPVTCFQCSSGFINDPNVTDSDPQVQAAERDLDNWLYRVFYVSNYEAAVLIQIALQRIHPDGAPLKIAVFADGGHRALASGIQPMLTHFYKQASVTDISYFTSLEKLPSDWDKVVKPIDASGEAGFASGPRYRRDASGSRGLQSALTTEQVTRLRSCRITAFAGTTF